MQQLFAGSRRELVAAIRDIRTCTYKLLIALDNSCDYASCCAAAATALFVDRELLLGEWRCNDESLGSEGVHCGMKR